MPVLQPSEYDISYFDGRLATLSHNAGYTVYNRWQRVSSDYVPAEQSTGEFWKDMALRYNIDHSLQNKKVLEIGCAKGFIVEALRDLGVNAYGIDVSEYAISCAREDIKPYLTVADARTYLSNYSNREFALLFSRRTLSCFTNAEITSMVTQMNRIAVQQVHSVWEGDNPLYYNVMPIQTFVDTFAWKKGTIFVNADKMATIYRK